MAKGPGPSAWVAAWTQAEEDSRQRIEQSESSQEARARAEQIVEEAEQRAKVIIANAERKVKKVKEDVETFANERTSGADQYAHGVLLRLEEEVSRVLGSIRKGIDTLDPEREVRA